MFSSFSYTYATGQIPSGIVADRFGPHLFLSTIVAAWSAALVGIAFTGKLVLLGFWRLLFGATQAGCYPSLTNISQEWFPLRQRTTLQVWVTTTSGCAGGTMSPIIPGMFTPVRKCGAWRSESAALWLERQLARACLAAHGEA